MVSSMKWNVYYHDINSGEIRAHNVFNHSGFRRDVICVLEKCKDKEDLAKQVRSSLMYYYWSKSEWEVTVGPWAGKGNTIKIDVFDQIMLNWDHFVDYLWELRK